MRYLLADEEEKLRAVIRRECPEREAELDLALFTGMRRGEQFTLKWKDMDLDRGMLTVKGKTGRRFILVNASTRAAIELIKERTSRSDKATAYVCPDATSDDQRDRRCWFETAVKKANIADFRYHDLRHTFASRLTMAGVDPRTLQSLLGHKSIVQTMRYSHLSPDHRQAAIEKIGAPARL